MRNQKLESANCAIPHQILVRTCDGGGIHTCFAEVSQGRAICGRGTAQDLLNSHAELNGSAILENGIENGG